MTKIKHLIKCNQCGSDCEVKDTGLGMEIFPVSNIAILKLEKAYEEYKKAVKIICKEQHLKFIRWEDLETGRAIDSKLTQLLNSIKEIIENANT